MNRQFIRFLRRARNSGGGGGASPIVNINLTSSLDSRITFTRAGTRNYINAGIVTSLASGQPAFESWTGAAPGMAIEPGFTNLVTYSNDFTQAIYTKNGGAVTAGDAAVGQIGPFTRYAAAATTDYHNVHREVVGISAGETHTLTAYVKVAAGSTNYSVRLRMSNQYNNDGQITYFRLDGSDGFVSVPDTTVITGSTYGYRKLSSGIYQVWITGTWVATVNGVKEFDVGVTANTAINAGYYTALVTDSVQIASVQFAKTSNPTGYVPTVAATANQAVESAIFNDISWLTQPQGTFVIEHDCFTGTLIGSGANTVLAASAPGKTAISWSGTTSDTVVNGGSTTSGVQPTFGADIRLLATSAISNAGHIKSIKFYNTRQTVLQMQLLTAKTVVSTATPGVLRGMSTKNRLPSIANVTSGNTLYHQVEFDVPLGNFAASSLKLDFPGIIFPGTAIGNSVIVDACYLRRVTGVSESVQVLVGGSGTFTVTSGAATSVISDAILPAAFTALTQFDPLMSFKIRMRCHVATSGQSMAGARSRYDPAGTFCIVYDPATITPTAVSGTGTMSYTGSVGAINNDYGYCPILVGVPVTGDPKTAFTVGDSIVEGIGSTTHQGPGLYIKKACMALGVPNIELSLGGTSQREIALSTGWTPYLKYARVLIDEMGTNNQNAAMDFFTYWNIARTTYGYDKIIHSGLTPVDSSSDQFATETNQTISRPYPNTLDTIMVGMEKYGLIDKNHVPLAARGVDRSKWIVNGTAFYATADGTHPSPAADDLMKTEFQPILAAITVT